MNSKIKENKEEEDRKQGDDTISNYMRRYNQERMNETNGVIKRIAK